MIEHFFEFLHLLGGELGVLGEVDEQGLGGTAKDALHEGRGITHLGPYFHARDVPILDILIWQNAKECCKHRDLFPCWGC